jgi:hypothetical protein
MTGLVKRNLADTWRQLWRLVGERRVFFGHTSLTTYSPKHFAPRRS